jgi:hypothetical protein
VPLQPPARPLQAAAVPRPQVQRPELIDADPPAVPRPPAVRPPDGPELGHDVGVVRLLPGLGPAQAHVLAAEQGAQPPQADGRDHPLLDQVAAQLGRRPTVHAGQGHGGAQGHLGDLLGQLGGEAAGPGRGLHPGVPGDAVQAVGVEAVDDAADPLGRAVHAGGDGAVGHATAGEQDDAGMPAVDGVGTLALEAVQFLLFVGPQRSYPNLVHGTVSTSAGVGASRCGDCLMRPTVPAGRYSRTGAGAKLTHWKRQ